MLDVLGVPKCRVCAVRLVCAHAVDLCICGLIIASLHSLIFFSRAKDVRVGLPDKWINGGESMTVSRSRWQVGTGWNNELYS